MTEAAAKRSGNGSEITERTRLPLGPVTIVVTFLIVQSLALGWGASNVIGKLSSVETITKQNTETLKTMADGQVQLAKELRTSFDTQMETNKRDYESRLEGLRREFESKYAEAKAESTTLWQRFDDARAAHELQLTRLQTVQERQTADIAELRAYKRGAP